MLRTWSLLVSLGAALVVACSTGACTVVSGVDDMAIRTTVPGAAASLEGGSAPNPFAFDPATSPDGGTDARVPVDAGDFVVSGSQTCGAAGSWTSCDATASTATCDEQCAQRGRTCVEDCCAYDGSSTVDYRGKVGLVYAVLTECSIPSMTSSATFGTCQNVPSQVLIAASGGLFETRCCCK
jgi:hypothetical protein